MNRAVSSALLSALIVTTGCSVDDAVVAAGGDAGASLDVATAPLTAREVSVDPLIPGLVGSTVQEALESASAALLLVSTRVAVLEGQPGGTAPVAADIAFDPTSTEVQATNLQTLGEALDLTTQLLSTDLDAASSVAGTAAADVAALEGALLQVKKEVTQALDKHSLVLDQTWDALDALAYAKMIELETPSTPLEDQIFDYKVLNETVTVYSAIEFLWGRIQALEDAASKPCPDDMHPTSSFCVDKHRFKEQYSWTYFARECHYAGKRLCTPAELYLACAYPGIAPEEQGPAGGFAVEEWMNQLLPGGEATTISGEYCTTVTAHHMEDQNYWARCCKDLTPTLPK